MPSDRGVYPGQWGLPGGGVEEDEELEMALRREVREELGVELTDIAPLFFKDAIREKQYPDGSYEMLHMVFLIYRCTVASSPICLNEELESYAWVERTALSSYDLNEATVDTFKRAGILD